MGIPLVFKATLAIKLFRKLLDNALSLVFNSISLRGGFGFWGLIRLGWDNRLSVGAVKHPFILGILFHLDVELTNIFNGPIRLNINLLSYVRIKPEGTSTWFVLVPSQDHS